MGLRQPAMTTQRKPSCAPERWVGWLVLSGLVAGLAGCQSPRGGEAKAARTVRVAGLVLKWVRADKETNFRRVEPMIREAASHGAQIVCTTECFLDGYAVADK